MLKNCVLVLRDEFGDVFLLRYVPNAVQDVASSYDPSSNWHARGSSALTSNLKIFVGFFQISSSITSAVDVNLPEAFVAFVSAFQVGGVGE